MMGDFGVPRRTQIGSTYVIAALAAAMAGGLSEVVGYEPNGGFLLGWDVTGAGRTLPALMTRDAVLLLSAGQAGATAPAPGLVELTSEPATGESSPVPVPPKVSEEKETIPPA